MPDTREKLIELVQAANDATNKAIDEDRVEDREDAWKFLADHLIANGVTVQKWIPVAERLPDRNDMVIAFYPTMRGTSGEIQIHKAWAMSDTCTHWMPLPEAPKGE